MKPLRAETSCFSFQLITAVGGALYLQPCAIYLFFIFLLSQCFFFSFTAFLNVLIFCLLIREIQWFEQMMTGTRYGAVDLSNFEPFPHRYMNYGTLDGE